MRDLKRYYSNTLDLVEHPEGCLCYFVDAEADKKAAVDAEREAITKIVGNMSILGGMEPIIEAIRARGEEPEHA